MTATELTNTVRELKELKLMAADMASYREAWAAAISRAGVVHFPMYHIRHIAVSEALAMGADIAAVSAQAGHSSVATTSSFYAHVISDAQQRAAALMPKIDEIEQVQL